MQIGIKYPTVPSQLRDSQQETLILSAQSPSFDKEYNKPSFQKSCENQIIQSKRLSLLLNHKFQQMTVSLIITELHT